MNELILIQNKIIQTVGTPNLTTFENGANERLCSIIFCSKRGRLGMAVFEAV